VSIAEARTGRLEGLELVDEAIVKRVLEGERDLYEILIRRHNQCLYRIARSILRDEIEAEDVMQDAYVQAYANLEQFEGRASFKTWLSRIAVHQALARLRRNGRFVEWHETMNGDRESARSTPAPRTPEDELGRLELGGILAQAIDSIPARHRLVFVLRQLEGMSTDEVAKCIGISADNVRARFHRAKVALRKEIDRRIGRHAPELFLFHLSRCDRVVANVLSRLPSRPPRDSD
jgi:RNA polymerase sigma-70 factor, ECF subfamily